MPEQAVRIYGWQRRLGRREYVEYLRLQRIVDRELAAILRDAANQGERLLEGLSGLDGAGARVRRTQYAQSVQALRRQQAVLWGNITDATASGIRRSTRIAVDLEMEMVQALTSGRSAQGAEALVDSMRAAARSSSENVRSRILNSIDLSPNVYKNQQLMSGKVAQTVNRGLALNKSAREIAKDVRRFIHPNVPGGVSYAAMRLGRTEINNALHATNVRLYEKHPWVEAVQWNLSGSHPRPDECNEYAEIDNFGMGRGIWPTDKVPSKPHPNCLCYTTAITPSVDQFLDNLTSGQYNDFLEEEGFQGF